MMRPLGHPLHLVDRVSAAQRTLDQFKGKPFRFGSCDCVRIVAWHLEQFGYEPPLAAAGGYSSAAGATKALRRAGFETLAAALDAIGLVRIPPASAWVGDIVQGESGDAFGALGVMLGNESMLGFHEHAPGAAVLRRIHVGTAWRVLPWRSADVTKASDP